MAGDDGGRLAQGIEQADHVADEMKQRVLVDRLGPVGLAIAAHVGRDGMVAGLGQRLQLMPPRVPGFGKAVAQHDQRAGALLGDVHLDAVGRDGPVH